MNRDQIVAALKKERDAIDRAISLLEGGEVSRGITTKTVKTSKRRGKRKLSAEGRARIAAASKARWARVRKEAKAK